VFCWRQAVRDAAAAKPNSNVATAGANNSPGTTDFSVPHAETETIAEAANANSGPRSLTPPRSAERVGFRLFFHEPSIFGLVASQENFVGRHIVSDSLVIMKRRSTATWKAGGRWLQQLRNQAGLSQLDLAVRLGIKHYSYVSQIETGLSRPPMSKLQAWAKSLDVDPTEFAEQFISFYEPDLYRMLKSGERSSRRA
jgi:DNA-binding XRE family transcriptional regulator